MTGLFLTEDQARGKWCPHVRAEGGLESGRLSVSVQPASNSIAPTGDDDDGCRDPEWASCIASACMSWRWAPKRMNTGETVADGVGYCGLAGRPE